MRRIHVMEDFDRMGGEIYYREDKYMHDPELRRAFKDGEECGYEKAMREIHGEYNERKIIDDRGRVIRYREHDRDWDDDYMERRRRDGRGRYM